MSLMTSQRAIAAALMMPLNRQGCTQRHAAITAAARLIQPNRQLSSRERLDIYCRGYWFRVLSSLREDFPGLAAILGAARFERVVTHYLAQCPSVSPTLRDLGARFEAWLCEHPNEAGKQHALALDMVRLEWAHIVAFDAASAPVLTPQEIRKPAQRFGLQPHMTLLDLHYPVDELRLRVNANAQDGPRLSAPADVFVAVHRADLDVYYRRLQPGEYRLLAALRDGRPLARAIASASEAGCTPTMLQAWFETWTRLGWLTAGRGRKE